MEIRRYKETLGGNIAKLGAGREPGHSVHDLRVHQAESRRVLQRAATSRVDVLRHWRRGEGSRHSVNLSDAVGSGTT